MQKDLPKVFANPINKSLTNNKDIYYSSNKEDRNINVENIPKKINEIFSSPHHVYKSKVKISTNNDTYESTIVGKTGNYLLTIKGERININDIKAIDRL